VHERNLGMGPSISQESNLRCGQTGGVFCSTDDVVAVRHKLGIDGCCSLRCSPCKPNRREDAEADGEAVCAKARGAETEVPSTTEKLEHPRDSPVSVVHVGTLALEKKDKWVMDDGKSEGDCEPPGTPCGALVLMSAYTSVKEVARAHYGMIAASLCAPMWETDSVVANRAMTRVPLCLVHAKEDEVVPLSHSRGLFSHAVAEAKVGIWLPEETHNFNVLGPYLEHVRAFLEETLDPLKKTVTGSNNWHTGQSSQKRLFFA